MTVAEKEMYSYCSVTLLINYERFFVNKILQCWFFSVLLYGHKADSLSGMFRWQQMKLVLIWSIHFFLKQQVWIIKKVTYLRERKKKVSLPVSKSNLKQWCLKLTKQDCLAHQVSRRLTLFLLWNMGWEQVTPIRIY